MCLRFVLYLYGVCVPHYLIISFALTGKCHCPVRVLGCFGVDPAAAAVLRIWNCVRTALTCPLSISQHSSFAAAAPNDSPLPASPTFGGANSAGAWQRGSTPVGVEVGAEPISDRWDDAWPYVCIRNIMGLGGLAS